MQRSAKEYLVRSIIFMIMSVSPAIIGLWLIISEWIEFRHIPVIVVCNTIFLESISVFNGIGAWLGFKCYRLAKSEQMGPGVR